MLCVHSSISFSYQSAKWLLYSLHGWGKWGSEQLRASRYVMWTKWWNWDSNPGVWPWAPKPMPSVTGACTDTSCAKELQKEKVWRGKGGDADHTVQACSHINPTPKVLCWVLPAWKQHSSSLGVLVCVGRRRNQEGGPYKHPADIMVSLLPPVE